MKLVHIENYELKIEDELLLLKPFRKLWKADKTKDKEHFMEFLSIIYFLLDPRSDYQYILNKEARLNEICESNGYKLREFTKDELLCMEVYEKTIKTTSLELLTATKIAIDKVKTFLEQVDLFAVDEKGKPLYTVNTITSAIKMIPELAQKVTETEKIISKEIEEAGRARGNQGAKSLMDDGVFE